MQGCKGLTTLRIIRSSYSLESPLIVRHLACKPVSQLNHGTGKKETLSRANLNLAHSTWARWWRSWPQQDGTPFLIVLAWRSLVDCSPIIHHGRASSLAHLHISMITIWMARVKQRISSRWLILNLHFILHSSSCWCLEVTWGLTSSSSSRHTWHLISFINFFLLQPWSQQMVQELPMDNSYKYNSMQTLVHRDCH